MMSAETKSHINKAILQEYSNKMWNKMNSENQLEVIGSYLSNLTTAKEKIRKIKRLSLSNQINNYEYKAFNAIWIFL